MAGIYVTNPSGTLLASAGNTLALNAATLSSSGSIQTSARNIVLGTLATDNQSNLSLGGGNFISQSTSTDIGSTISAKGNVSMSASNQIVGVAANIAGGNVNLSGANGVDLLAGQSLSTGAMSLASGSSGLFSSQTSTQGQAASSKALGTTVTGGNVSITSSSGDITLQAANINAANALNLSAVNGTVALTSANQTSFYSTSSTSSSTLTRGASGNGQSSTNASFTQLKYGSGGLSIAAKQTTVDVPVGQAAADLATQPDMAYIGQLLGTTTSSFAGNVTWNKVQQASQSWNYNQQGLSPAGAAILAIAVAVGTSGMGSSLATTSEALGTGTTMTVASSGGVALSSVGATGLTTYTAAGAALNAGFSSLAAQAAVSLANNGGDIGKTLQQLGSSQSIMQTLAAMATAGVGTAASSATLSGVATQTLAGCATGEMTGVGCNRGATNAAVLAGAANIYTNTVGYAANAGPGFNNPNAPFYEPDPVTGQQPVSTFGQNVIGFNAAGSAGSQGSAISNFLNNVPFINATAGLHDFIFNAPNGSGGVGLMPQTAWNNIWTMGAAAVPSIAASLNNPNISWMLINGTPYVTTPKQPVIPSVIRIPQPTFNGGAR